MFGKASLAGCAAIPCTCNRPGNRPDTVTRNARLLHGVSE